MCLLEYLDTKPLYYTEIDYTRMPRVYEKIKANFLDTNIIHLVGTNAKGTTGRFLAVALYNQGYSVAHYTSPHIVEFNERIWINGENVSYDVLELAHKKLQRILSTKDADSLSYFEYTTFLAMLVFHKNEYIILEAGLGGEHDATAVFEKKLTLVTPIDYDHEDFLGTTIKEIASQKLNATQNNAILAYQKHNDVYSVAKKLQSSKKLNIINLNELINTQDKSKISLISKELSLASNLEDNSKLSIAALNFFNIKYTVHDFKNSKLFGRLSHFKKNILLDVGLNVLAAESIVGSLENKKYILIYNTFKDKNYKKILEILKPIIKHVEILNIDNKRIESISTLQKVLNDIEVECQQYVKINDNEQYLVFGSFKVVEEFMKRYNG